MTEIDSAWEGNGLRRAGAGVIAAARTGFLGVDRDATKSWRAEDWYIAGYVAGARSTDYRPATIEDLLTWLDSDEEAPSA